MSVDHNQQRFGSSSATFLVAVAVKRNPDAD
jgi:hypothetical protein